MQDFSHKLDGEIHELLDDLDNVVNEFKILALPENVALTGFEFPKVSITLL